MYKILPGKNTLDNEEAVKFCDGYKDFLDNCKTERECVNYAIKNFNINTFTCKDEIENVRKVLDIKGYVAFNNRDKSIILYRRGKRPITDGVRIVGSHIDSPRLDFKANPIYQSGDFCMFDTHYYGGIKKYQWTALPLALHGVIFDKQGKKQEISIGEKEDEPVFCISDLLPHLENDKAKIGKIEGENLNILGGTLLADYHHSYYEEKSQIKSNILNILSENNILEQDLFSAEIEVVPAGKSRDCGLDKSMVMGYGQDDRVCAYTSIKAFLDTKNPEYCSICFWADKEEIGSVGATGMSSMFFENTIAEILNIEGVYSELNLRRTLQNSSALSSDVTAAVDPNYPAAFNDATDAHFTKGLSLNKYTGAYGKSGSNDANPEFIAKLRKIFDKYKVKYQATEMGKVDQGGGGTIAYLLAKYNMEVIDAGVPVLNMHAPFEVTCKADVYEAYKAYLAFYESDI